MSPGQDDEDLERLHYEIPDDLKFHMLSGLVHTYDPPAPASQVLGMNGDVLSIKLLNVVSLSFKTLFKIIF